MTLHQSVLLEEAINGLAIKRSGVYVDATFGRGGHSQAILNHLDENGRLLVIDKDLEAIAFGQKQFANEPRIQFFHGSFANLAEFTKKAQLFGKINGILMDLGVSSPQLDDASRGFSFMHDGPLDMRMDKTQDLDAAQFVNTAEVSLMTQVFREYGEERFAGRIARAIEKAREENPFSTTAQLALVVKEANPKWEKHKHPATRVFQAIRIYVNGELTELSSCLSQCIEVLAPEGRLAVISFHSLEDRIVKQFMRDKEVGERLPIGVPVRHEVIKTDFKRVGKALKPKDSEVYGNVRARSAVLRIGEKIA